MRSLPLSWSTARTAHKRSRKPVGGTCISQLIPALNGRLEDELLAGQIAHFGDSGNLAFGRLLGTFGHSEAVFGDRRAQVSLWCRFEAERSGRVETSDSM